jgi:3-hydroxyisobutyrate dehydrogenase-like beta-hydroxyacid dehydrogenase
MKVGLIGLGQMGAGMAMNLLKAGHELTIHNRTRSKTRALVDKGARAAEDIAQACQGDAVFTMLADDLAVESVVYGDGGILAHLRKGAVHISASTISVALSERLTADHAAAAQRFVAAPVFGRPEMAEKGHLFVVAAGAADAVGHVDPLLAAVGQRTFVVSDEPKAANLVKLSGNFLIASVIESLGEALALVAKGGVDKRQYLELLTSTLFPAPIYKTYGDLIVQEKFEPAGFAVPLGHKDIRLVLAAGEQLRVPMPLANILRDRLLTLLARGQERLDWSALGNLPARDAGAD